MEYEHVKRSNLDLLDESNQPVPINDRATTEQNDEQSSENSNNGLASCTIIYDPLIYFSPTKEKIGKKNKTRDQTLPTWAAARRQHICLLAVVLRSQAEGSLA